MNSIIKISIAAFFILSQQLHAEVLDKGAGGFTLEFKATVPQPVETSYQQFLRIGEWWDGNHSWFGDANNFYLEAKIGGCFCEVDGERAAQHMRVSYIEPNKEVRLLGGLGPLQMMGVSGAMSWKFIPVEEDNTEITQRYTVVGYAKDGLDKLADVVDQVQGIQMQRLVDKLTLGVCLI